MKSGDTIIFGTEQSDLAYVLKTVDPKCAPRRSQTSPGHSQSTPALPRNSSLREFGSLSSPPKRHCTPPPGGRTSPNLPCQDSNESPTQGSPLPRQSSYRGDFGSLSSPPRRSPLRSVTPPVKADLPVPSVDSPGSLSPSTPEQFERETSRPGRRGSADQFNDEEVLQLQLAKDYVPDPGVPRTILLNKAQVSVGASDHKNGVDVTLRSAINPPPPPPLPYHNPPCSISCGFAPLTALYVPYKHPSTRMFSPTFCIPPPTSKRWNTSMAVFQGELVWHVFGWRLVDFGSSGLTHRSQF